MNKKLLSAVAAIILLVVAYAIFKAPRGGAVFGDSAVLHNFTANGESTGKAMLTTPFLKTLEGQQYASAWIDDLLVLDNLPIHAKKDENNNLIINSSGTRTDTVHMLVAVSKKKLEQNWNKKASADIFTKNYILKPKAVEVATSFDLSKVTNPEESMTGINLAFAETPEAADSTNTPDISQRIAECAPTAAANSLISLMKRNGAGDKVPKNPEDIINQLKVDTLWIPADGALPDNFVAGKNVWAARMGLPIRTEKVGDTDGRGTLQELGEAINSGAGAEIRIRFTAPGGTKAIGGHMVTVISVQTDGAGNGMIEVHDPASPTGTETLQIEGNQITNYALWKGDAYIGYGFTQTWENTGIPLEPLTDAEITGIQRDTGGKPKIKVIVVGSHYIPFDQVHVGKGPECKDGDKEMPHYHTNSGYTAEDVNGTKVNDPGGCGFGMVKDIPVIDIDKP